LKKVRPTQGHLVLRAPIPRGCEKLTTKPAPSISANLTWKRRGGTSASKMSMPGRVPVEEIVKRGYNLDVKNPKTAETSDSMTSVEVLHRIECNVARIQELISILKTEIK
jgi:hypothetical protein